jgi:ABC-2 type transport system permease protein
MFASFTAELFKLRKRSVFWLIAGIWMVMTLVFGYLFPYFSYNGTPTGPSVGGRAAAEQVLAEALPASLTSSAIQGFPLFAGALALVIGVLCGGGEYGWQTMKMLFTQGPRRLSVLGGKLSALLLMMLLIVIATFIVDGAASWLVAAVESKPMDWPPIGQLARGVLAGWLIVGMWATCGMFLGIMVRGTALGVGLGLVWALAVENLMRIFAAIVGPIDFLQRYFPGTNAGALAGALGVTAQGQPGGTPGVTTVVSGTQSAVVLLVYVVVFAAISAIVLNRRDVT